MRPSPPSPLIDSSGFSRSRLRVFASLACFLFGCLPSPPAAAHLLLYENIEVNLVDPARIRIEFTIHAPELPSAVARGIDPAAVDDSWLKSLDEESLLQLCQEAERFIRSTFVLEQRDAPLLEHFEIVFDEPKQIQAPSPETKLPPGCLLATCWLENELPNAPLTVGFAPGAQKRLLLAVSRPSAFPEIHDLAPGEQVAIPLPPISARESPFKSSIPQPSDEPETIPWRNSAEPVAGLLVLTILLAVAYWIRSRGRHSA